MRYLKLALGVIFLLGAVWVIVVEQLAGVSVDATINGPVTLLRPPISGMVRLEDRQVGSTVSPGDLIATVSDDRSDQVHLEDLKMERSIAAANLNQARADLANLQAALFTMNGRTSAITRIASTCCSFN